MGNPLIPSVDSDTKQFPTAVRQRMAANLTDPTTVEGAAATAIAGKAAPRSNLSFIANIDKATAGQFRVALFGMSISTFEPSPIRVVSEHLRGLYGDAGEVFIRGFELGGSFEAAYLGWAKQNDSGPAYGRARGASTATAQTYTFYGDTVELDAIRETDSEAVNVLGDGLTMFQTPAPGAQNLSVRTVYKFATVGLHTVTLPAPVGAGYVYWRSLLMFDSTRPGVMVLNYTYGGSTLGNMVRVRAKTGAQVTEVPTVGDNGITAHFDRPDFDAVLVAQDVNDAGSGPLTGASRYVATVFAPTLTKILALVDARRTPLGLVSSPPGHYLMPNDGGAGSGNYDQYNEIHNLYVAAAIDHNTVTHIDWAAASVAADIISWAARYYPNVTGIDLNAGTYTGDFIHPDQTDPRMYRIGTALLATKIGVTVPSRTTVNDVRANRYRTLPIGGADARVRVGTGRKRYAQPSGASLLALGPGRAELYQGRTVPWYRDESVTNQFASDQATILASTSSDQNGPYVGPWQNKNFGLGLQTNGPDGRQLLTIRFSGTLAIRASLGARIYSPDGAVFPFTDAANGRTLVTHTTSTAGDASQVASVWVGQAQNNGNIDITGPRIYDIALVDASAPILA